ncbi:MBL fold metallo-hydrolase [Myxococcota bacterium]
MHIETLAVGPLGCNCSLLMDAESGRAVVIDPGGDAEHIMARLQGMRAHVEALLHTHAHLDHVGGTGTLQRLTHAPAEFHSADRFLFDIWTLQASVIGCPVPELPRCEFSLEDNAVFAVGSMTVRVLHTPGHSPGGVCFLAEQGSARCLFAGDTVFRGGVGRTDLWGGDSEALVRSIRERVFSLPGDTQIIPGHGPDTSVVEERSRSFR